MNISISTGADGLPSTSPFCGMPWKSAFASGAPSRAPAQLAFPMLGRPWSKPPLPPLPPRLRTTPTTIARARGDAWRGRTPPMPFDRTGGGVLSAVAASRLCCLALLPLGMRGKGSRLVGFPGGREDQESDEKEEAGEGEGRDGQVAERRVWSGGDPVYAAAACRVAGDAGRRLLDGPVLDQHVVDRDAGAGERQQQKVARHPVFAVPGEEQENNRERVHADALEPAQLARLEARDLGV